MRAIFRIVALFGVVAVLGSVLSGSPAVRADPVESDLLGYRLLVPVEILAGATSAGPLTQAEQVALLANTVNASAPSVSIPITPPVPVSVPANTSLGAGVATPVIGGLLSFALTTQGLRAVGVDYEGGLCPGATQGNLVDGFLAAVTATDCTQWRISSELEARMNLDAKPLPNPSAVGSTSCDPHGRCAQIYSVATPSPNDPNRYYCVRHVSGPLFTGTNFGGDANARIPLVGLTSPYDRNQWWGGRTYLTDNVPPGCPSIPGVQLSSISLTIGATTPLPYWAADTYAVTSGGIAALPAPLREDPTRTIRCVVNYAGGASMTGVSEVFTLGTGIVPRPNCPAPQDSSWLPQNIESIDLWLDSASTASVHIGHTTLSPQSRLWFQSASAACLDGNCALDLRRTGSSCFEGGGCEDWLTSANRDAEYTCWYAGDEVELSSCYIYGPTFQSAGPAYGDFSTGASLSIRTTLSEEDRLVSELLARGWEPWGPTASGFQTGRGDEAKAARTVARQCVAMAIADDCRRLPIFSPGDNVKEAAQHDLDAIRGLGSTGTHAPAVLTRGQSSVSAGWYRAIFPCNVSYDGNEYNCDEYPYASSIQAGPPLASIRVISKKANFDEGQYLLGFYNACGVAGDFAVVPVPTDGHSVVTTTEFFCE